VKALAAQAAAEMPAEKGPEGMIDNSWRIDFEWVADHLERVGMASRPELTFQHIRDMGSDAEDDGPLRGGSGTDGRAERRIPLEELQGAAVVRKAV
jgi:hypothetical protein